MKQKFGNVKIIVYLCYNKQTMELKKAMILAVNLMKEHGIWDKGWIFGFDNAKRRFGVCTYNTKTIKLSKHLVELNDESMVRDTILHEVAHAIVGYKHGHNDVWKAKAIEIGCNGERCYNSLKVITPKAKYEAMCTGCGYLHKKHKKTILNSSCGYCSGGVYNDKYKLVWKQNY